MQFVEGLTSKLITLTIMVLVIASVAIPVITDLQDRTESVDNTGYRAIMTDVKTEITVTLTSDGFTVGSHAFTTSYNGYYIAMADNNILMYTGSGSTPSLQLIDLTTPKLTNISVIGSTVTYNNGSYTLTTGGSTTTGTYSGDLKILSTSGAYGIWRAGDVFFNDDSQFWFFANSTFTVGSDSVNIRGIVSGTISSMAWNSAINASSNPMAIVAPSALAAVVTSTISEADGAKSFASFDNRLSYTVAGNTYSVTNTGSTYVIAEISYDIDADLGTMGSLIQVIPIMLILVAVMFAVNLIRSRN